MVGLKNSGKTTVAEALISGLAARGLRVAAIKTSHVARLDLEGRDSRRLYDAGAHCVVAQGRGETLVVRRHAQPPPFPALLRLLPEDTEVVIAESGTTAGADLVLVCLVSPEQLEETLEVRGVSLDRVRALSGLAAAGLGGSDHPAARLPFLDAATPEGREALTALVLEAAGGPAAPTSDPRTS
ncbi:MAG: molybdopterin-guanine dinucleotide biosynthesis protein MobB [Spirochaetales bacterium]|nr:molybdopterin-guanine dinucleotide biosynthesis protein MobB [Spirochaetales bacterium]